MTAGSALAVRGLTKDFTLGLRGARVRAVDNLSLRVEAGQVFGLLGPNGSGKSTTIKVVLDLLTATAGDCLIFGQPNGRIEARREIGYLPESPHFHRCLTGRELLRFYGGVCGLRGARLRARVEEVIAWSGLEQAAGRPVGTYSKGMLQRIGLAQALVHEPRLVILDEPTAGLDVAGAAEMKDLIVKLKTEGRTVLVVSHQLAEMDDICDRAAILDRGRLVWEGAVSGPADASGPQTLTVDPLTPDLLAELGAWLAARGSRLRTVEPARSRLAEVMLLRTGAFPARDRVP
jgi:ABC-2 type transport system ATP-binding protein